MLYSLVFWEFTNISEESAAPVCMDKHKQWKQQARRK
jgi:hypothetical protein